MRAACTIKTLISSTCLPAKVLLLLAASEIFAYSLERLPWWLAQDEMVVAKSSNELLAQCCKTLGVLVFRGNFQDLQDCCCQRPLEKWATAVVPNTGGCTGLTLHLIDEMVASFKTGRCYIFYLSREFLERLYCAVVPFATLKIAWRESDLPSEREHVNLANEPGFLHLASLEI